MKVKINNSLEIYVESTSSIVTSAKEHGLTIRHSCLSGRCSECKVRVVSGDFEMPITQEVYAVIHKGKSPREAVLDLLDRAIKQEN